MFVSTVPLNIHIEENEDFVSFTRRIAVDLISILRHQSYPYQNILEDIRKNKQIKYEEIIDFVGKHHQCHISRMSVFPGTG